ncbi:MAG: hypothetical protein AAGA95_21515 [Pseudomonadota bacterium]
MRHLNKPALKRLKNLQTGHVYVPPQTRVERDQFIDWIGERTEIMSNLIGPLSGLVDRLSASWVSLENLPTLRRCTTSAF